jgi:hypothetical protein
MTDEAAGIGFVAILAFVSKFLSFGVLIPDQLSSFSLLAAAGVMAGLPIGRTAAKKVKGQRYRIILILVALVICVSSLLAYLVSVQSGSANVNDIIWLAVFLTVTFVSFTFLMGMAGVALVKD